MKTLFFVLLTAVALTFATDASATGAPSAADVQHAIQERIDDLKDDVQVLKAALNGAGHYERRRIRKQIRVLKYRIQQLACIKRQVPRLSPYQLKCLAHYLNLNVSFHAPYS